MAKFVITEKVGSPLPQIESMAIGTAGQLFDNADRGKLVKLATGANAHNNYVLCAAGDEIEAVIDSIEPGTVNSGYCFGGIRKSDRILAVVDAAQGGQAGTAMAVGDLVVAGTQSAVGTNDPYPLVKTGTPTTFKWRVIRVYTNGLPGDKVILERV